MKKFLFISLLLQSVVLRAQDLPNVSISGEGLSLEAAIESLEKQTGYIFHYQQDWIDTLKVTSSINNLSLDRALTMLFEHTSLYFLIHDDRVYLTNEIQILTRPKLSELLNSTVKIQENIEKGLVFKQEYLLPIQELEQLNEKVFEIGKRSELRAGGSATIAGYIKNAQTGEPLISALVYSEKPLMSTLTDETGFYSLTLPLGRHLLRFQLVGMKQTVRNVVLFSSGQLNVQMNEDITALDEVVIESNRDANIESVQMGVSSIRVKDSKNVPIVLGERDVMKVATTMAGIQSVGEGASGFNVRGGKADQNLIMLDGYPLYNTSHFFGFFSVFNSEVIEDMQVYKSSIPVQFGGRLSSVMDIESKKANRDSISGSGGISPITSKLTLELPLFSGKAGLTLGGRATYSDWVLNNVGNSEFAENEVFFADILMRYDHDFDENNRLAISGYCSADRFRMNSDTLFSFSNFAYQNRAISARFGHIFSRNLSGSLTAAYSDYYYDLSYTESPENAFVQDFRIREKIIRGQMNYTPFERHELVGGIESKLLKINPGTQTPFDDESLVNSLIIQHEKGLEAAIFLSDQYNYSDRLSFYGGIRYSMFTSMGGKTVYEYAGEGPKNDQTRTDSVSYGKGEVIKTFGGLEPRLSVRYKLDRNASIKAGYNRSRQYVHTLTNSASVSPTDIWRLSGYHLEPQIADQFSVGFYQNLARFLSEASFEVYYKSIENLLDFKVGAEFLLNPFVETVSLQGPGKSYGFEFSLKKKGNLSGWLNYTYARTFLKLDSEFAEERINGGSYYPTNYDIPHTVNLVANYKLTRRVSLSYNFVYKSGRPITYPAGVYDFYKSISIHYSDRNAYRIPYYMRMDFGVNLEAGHRKNKLAYSYWSFSVYNLLGRSNPYSVFFSVKGREVSGHQLVVFRNPIPTISYNFKF
ncbi:MAG: TonB-dependent receptor [Cyclobacteriaceae bacterium]